MSNRQLRKHFSNNYSKCLSIQKIVSRHLQQSVKSGTKTTLTHYGDDSIKVDQSLNLCCVVDLVHKHLHIKKAKQSFAKYKDNKIESKIFTKFTVLAVVNEQVTQAEVLSSSNIKRRKKKYRSGQSLVFLAAFFSVVTQRSSLQTAIHIRTAFLSFCANEITNIVSDVTNQSKGECNQHRFSREPTTEQTEKGFANRSLFSLFRCS